jgi:hypothetical protein
VSFRKDILRLVQANPGLGLVDLGAKLKLRTSAKRQRLSTQLSIEVGKRNLRRTGKRRAYCYYPNARTQAAIDREHGQRITPQPKKTTPAKPARPISRNQRIVDILQASRDPMPLAAIAHALDPSVPEADRQYQRIRVSAALAGLYQFDRVQRIGEFGNYHYTVPGRDVSGFRLPAKPTAAPRKPAKAVKPTAAQQVQIVAVKLPPPAPTPRSAPFETVEQFLARGGRIERLPNGASADPLRITRADIDAANWRRREQRNNESP